ncbi:hypothetical protein K9M41_01900 [Candidatus Gracilibacteria bacterium]|nr:hypothetical protein [Candidatus Gracilibacteria bacterium]
MNPTKISASVLKKIKTQNIVPKSKWQFLFKNVLLWILFGFSVLLSAIGVSVIIFAFRETDFDLFSYLDGSALQRFLSLLPIFWLLFFAVFVGIALIGLRKTKRGYRFSVSKLLLVNMVLGILLGTVFYNLGGSEKFESVFANNVRFYRGIHNERLRRWARPSQGRLAGEIIEIKKEQIFLLNDFDQKEWRVDARDLIRELPFELQVGMKIRMIGEEISKNEFKAKVIRPWRMEPRRDLKGERRRPEMRFPGERPMERNEFLKNSIEQ